MEDETDETDEIMYRTRHFVNLKFPPFHPMAGINQDLVVTCEHYDALHPLPIQPKNHHNHHVPVYGPVFDGFFPLNRDTVIFGDFEQRHQ